MVIIIIMNHGTEEDHGIKDHGDAFGMYDKMSWCSSKQRQKKKT